MVTACSSPAPAPTLAPTAQPPPTATRIAVPTSPPAVPTAKKMEFPRPERPITVVVQSPVGGVADSAARLLAPGLERQMGTPVQISNRTGDSGNSAIAEFAGANPDGYTLMLFSAPATLATYLDPGRKASFDRSSFVPVAGLFADRLVIAVRTESNFAIPSDVVEYAKAHPGDFAVGTSGNLGAGHLGALAWATRAGVTFSYYPFPSSIEAIARLLIGRLDAVAVTVSSLGANVRAGNIRPLGVMDERESLLLPGTPTFAAQGFAVSAPAYYFLAAPAGTPAEIVDALSASLKKVVESDALRIRLAEIGLETMYMAPADLGAYWTSREDWARPLVEEARK